MMGNQVLTKSFAVLWGGKELSFSRICNVRHELLTKI